MQVFSPVLCLSLLGHLAFAAVKIPDGHVFELNENSIHQFINSNESVLVKFFAPWFVFRCRPDNVSQVYALSEPRP